MGTNKQDLQVASGEIKTLTDNADYGVISVAAGGTLIIGENCSVTSDQIYSSGTVSTMKNSQVQTDSLVLNSSNVTVWLDSFYAREISVESGINAIDGTIHISGLHTANTFSTAEGSVLTASRYQLDELFLRQSIHSDGTVVITDGMDQEQIWKIIRYNSFRKVKVNGVTGFNNVTFLDNQVLEISAANSFTGTPDNDTVTIGKSAVVTLGGDIVLGDRTNQFIVKQNASSRVTGTLKDVTKLKVEKGVGISAGNGKYQKYTEARFGAIILSRTKSSITVGDYVFLCVDGENGTGDVTGYDGRNQITIGSNSRMEVRGDVSVINTLKLSSGKQFKSYSRQSTSEQGISSLDFGGKLTGTGGNDTVSIGNYTNAHFGSISTGAGNDKLTVGKYATFASGDVHLGDTVNKITVGDYASFSAGAVYLGTSSGKSTLKFGKYSSVSTAGIAGVYTLKTGCGKSTEYASFASSGAISGTDFKDQYTFGDFSHVSAGSLEACGGDDKLTIGKYSTFESGTVDLGDGQNTFSLGSGSSADIRGDALGICKLSLPSGNSAQHVTFHVSGNMGGTSGNDKFSVGKYTDINVGGISDFGGGTDKLTIDTGSSVVLKSTREQCSSLSKFTIASKAVAYLSTELRDRVTSLKGTVIDIGTCDTAVNFTSIADEQSDDTLVTARSFSGTYNGWLKSTGTESYEKDENDFFQRGSVNAISLTPGAGASLMVVLYGEDGNAETISTHLDHIDLDKYDGSTEKARIAAFEIRFIDGWQHEAAAYTLASLS